MDFRANFIVSARNIDYSSITVQRPCSISCRVLSILAFGILLGSCESYGPFHPNTATEPLNSIRGPSDGRYKFAFIEFGDQGSALDTSQRAAAITAIRQMNLITVGGRGMMGVPGIAARAFGAVART